MDGIQLRSIIPPVLRFQFLKILLRYFIVESCRVNLNLGLSEALELMQLVSSESLRLDCFGPSDQSLLDIYSSVLRKIIGSLEQHGFTVQIVVIEEK